MTISVYPPYQTTAYQRCPMLWDLQKRWEPRRDTSAMVVGTAVARGLEFYYKGQSAQAAVDELILGVELGFAVNSQRTIEEVTALAIKGFDLAVHTDFGAHQVLAVEKLFGRCRPDLVLRTDDGRITPVDHKVKIQLDPKYYSSECRRFNTDGQAFAYAMAVGEAYGKHVEEVLFHLIILGPRPRTLLHRVLITAERLAYWRSGAEEAWQNMHELERRGVRPAPQFTGCLVPFECDFYQGCHGLAGDESVFETLYVKKAA